MPSSRKKWLGKSRFGSPPLQPQPLAVRNSSLLPVSLSDLPTDATFIEPLRQDVRKLLDRFAHQWSLERHQSTFEVFSRYWIDLGWDYVHFAYTDYKDTQRKFCQSISRVFLEFLPAREELGGGREAIMAVGVLFGLFILWDTQIHPTSGLGSAYSRKACETIAVEADVLQTLLLIPTLCRDALNPWGPGSSKGANHPYSPAVVDVVYVLRHLCGYTSSEQPAEERATQEEASQPAQSSKGKKKQAETIVGPTSRNIPPSLASFKIKGEGIPILDIIPPTTNGTRMPRTFPSSRLMTKVDADRALHRLGRVVSVNYDDEDDDDEEETEEEGTSKKRKVRDSKVLCGLSRGDLIRLRARERLDLATSDTAGIPDADAVETKIELPSWIAKDKYKYRLRPWLDNSSRPLEMALGQLTQDREEYRQIRCRIIQGASEGDSQTGNDYSAQLLEQFSNGGETHILQGLDDANLQSDSPMSIQDIYRIAAKRTSEAIAAARQEVERRT